MPLLAGARVHRADKGSLNPLVLLSAHSDCRLGIGFTPEMTPNASIESTRPVGGNPHQSPERADWPSGQF